MSTGPNNNPNRPDPFAGYLGGARDAVDAVRPDEPSEEQWEAVLRGVQARLSATTPAAPAPSRARWRRAPLIAGIAGGAILAATAAALAWVAFAPVAVKSDVANARPVVPAAALPSDPLAEFDVLPMASAEEVDLHRVPGSGWFPVGSEALPEVLVLATHKDVELDDPDSTWPAVTPSPEHAPMIFAAKPR